MEKTEFKAEKKLTRNQKCFKETNLTHEDKRKIKKNQSLEAINSLKEKIPDIDNIFDIHGRVGNGTFSTVFLGSMKCENEISSEKRKLFAIKHLIPTSHPNRIIKELKCLVDIGGHDNVAGINLCLRRNESVAFVMPYIPHDRFQDFYDKMKLIEIQSYFRNLLIALRRVHSFNIIHRDVKPSNFLFNRKTGKCMLVDFGLAQSIIKIENSDRELKRKLIAIDPAAHGDAKKRHFIETDTNTPTSTTTTSLTNKVETIVGSNVAVNDEINSKTSFKMPLKQVNDNISSKLTTNKNDKVDSSLDRHVKSSVLGFTMTNRLQEKIRNNRAMPSTSPNLQTNANNNNNNNSNSINGNNNNNNNSNNTDNNNSHEMKYNTKRSAANVPTNKCNCFGKGQVCNICLVRKEIPASRAGTPGYRPPEVLLKYTDQTCAVDMWAVGVILISILSGVYPFFKAPDDYVALAEIVMLFGDESIRKTAYTLDRHVTMSRKCKPLNLRKLCVRLKNRSKIDRTSLLKKYQENGKKCEECLNCQQMFFDCLCENTKYKTESIGVDHFPNSVYDLLAKLLEVDPFKRITAVNALEHQFFKEKFD